MNRQNVERIVHQTVNLLFFLFMLFDNNEIHIFEMELNGFVDLLFSSIQMQLQLIRPLNNVYRPFNVLISVFISEEQINC